MKRVGESSCHKFHKQKAVRHYESFHDFATLTVPWKPFHIGNKCMVCHPYDKAYAYDTIVEKWMICHRYCKHMEFHLRYKKLHISKRFYLLNLLTCMQPFMLLEEIFCGESLVTYIAFPLLVIMNLHMLIQMRFPLEELVTDLAFESRMFNFRSKRLSFRLYWRFITHHALLNSEFSVDGKSVLLKF